VRHRLHRRGALFCRHRGCHAAWRAASRNPILSPDARPGRAARRPRLLNAVGGTLPPRRRAVLSLREPTLSPGRPPHRPHRLRRRPLPRTAAHPGSGARNGSQLTPRPTNCARRPATYLENRLRFVDAHKTHPEIAAGAIHRPIFVLGLPPARTTILHDLLAQDPATACR